MILIIDKEILGFDKHLYVDISTGSCTFSDIIRNDCWYYGNKNTIKNVKGVYKMNNMDIPVFPPERYVRMWEQISSGSCLSPPWKKIVPKNIFKPGLKNLILSLSDFILNIDDYYRNVYFKNTTFLSSLSPALVNKSRLEELIRCENNISIVENLKKFKPGSGLSCDIPAYSLCDSVTGRMTVTSGPNILTLKKSHRDIFKSSYENGSICMIDLVSLEPRVRLASFKSEIPRDIYSHIGENIFEGKLSRADAKLMTIGTIYGMSHRMLGKKLKSSIPVRTVYKKVRDYFKIDELERENIQMIKEIGYIKNAFGRRIYSSDAPVNHFIQSTAADVAIICFSKIVSMVNIKPHFLIHDALILDCPSSSIDDLKQVCAAGIEIDKMKGNFYLSFKKLS